MLRNRYIHKVINLTTALTIKLIALSLVLIAWAVRPFLLVRWGPIPSRRIGHFAMNVELYLAEKRLRKQTFSRPTIDIFWLEKPVCNWALLRLWRRHIILWPKSIAKPLYETNRRLGGSKTHELTQLIDTDRDIGNILDRISPMITFHKSDHRLGRETMEALGVPHDSRFVCVNVRDSQYMESYMPGGDWTYHNFRDADIDNFSLAIEALVKRGYFVIRMGRVAGKPVSVKHPMVVDYAMSEFRNDFLDIYLASKCVFAISTGTGWDSLPNIFRKPIVFVNHAPFGHFNTFSDRFINITKHYYSKEKDAFLSIREVTNMGLHGARRTEEFSQQSVTLIENSPNEILDITNEMLDRLEGQWKSDPVDANLQDAFWNAFPTDMLNPQGRKDHGEIRARVGTKFIRDNQWLLG